ncbi:unnamed protein product [Durusdinium trenchii]|uniref:Uncharacterized protein n=2 Tax=Durusdinium trenchii TaxID=1381693 RepID=A0ABP0QMZ5_9DINO
MGQACAFSQRDDALEVPVLQEKHWACCNDEARAERSSWLKKVQQRGLQLEEASEHLRNNKKIVRAAVEEDGRALQFASKELRSDKQVVQAAVKQNGWALQFASEKLRGDKEVVQIAVDKNGRALQFASKELRSDKQVVQIAVQEDGRALQFASEELGRDKEVVQAAVQAAVEQNVSSLEFAPEELNSDREGAPAKGKQHGLSLRSLQLTSQELWTDEAVVQAAVDLSAAAFLLASDERTSDKEVVQAAVEEDGRALQFVSEKLRSDKEVVQTAVKRNGWALQFASEELRGDKEIVQAAIKSFHQVLDFFPLHLEINKEVVLAMVQQVGWVLEFASEELRSDKEVVRAAVKRNGWAFEFASEKLRSNKAVVQAAVEAFPAALQFASEELRRDKEVVRALVEKDGRALQFAAEELRSNKEVALAAIKSKTAVVAAEQEELHFIAERHPKFTVYPKQVDMMSLLVSESLMRDKSFAKAVVEFRGWHLRAFAPHRSDPEIVLAAVRENGRVMEFASEALKKDRKFVLRAVKATKATWLLNYCSKELQKDDEFKKLVKQTAGTGLVFTYYHSFSCFESMRDRFVATGASIPGGPAYEHVMTKLKETKGGTATVWFDEMPVFSSSANDGQWVHPSEECGRDDVPVPPPENRHEMWESMVESRTERLVPEVGSKHPCWCCHWLRKVKQKHAEGAVICIAASNIYDKDWVDEYGAGSSELSDEAAEKFGLKKEQFRNGRPAGWGTGKIQISNGMTFSRVAPVHPHTGRPLGEGCRWERQALDRQNFAVYAYFVP